MSAPELRRGACPTLLDPMATGDGWLVRLRLSEGGFRPAQMAGLAEAAARHGNGLIEITARGSLQARGLSEGSAARFAADIDALGIAPAQGVPVETGPLAGLDPAETADPRPLARAIQGGIEAARLVERLGAKVSVVVDGGGAIPLGAVLADIRLDAIRENGRTAWRLALAGTAASAAVLGTLDEARATGAVLGRLEDIATRGKEARARDLLADPALPGIAGRARVDPAEAIAFEPEIALRDGRIAVRAALPFGRIGADALSALATAATLFGADELRLCPDHALLVLGPAAKAPALRDAAGRLGLVVDADDPRRRVGACAGAPACASAHLDTKRLAAELAQALAPGGARVHLSGCAKRCGEPAGALSVVGVGDGRLSVNGGDAVAAGEAPALTRRALAEPAAWPERAA